MHGQGAEHDLEPQPRVTAQNTHNRQRRGEVSKPTGKIGKGFGARHDRISMHEGAVLSILPRPLSHAAYDVCASYV